MDLILRQFTRWVDPKLDQYRAPVPYTPRNSKELMAVLRRTPKEILNDRERDMVIAASNFRRTRVSEIMIPHSDITFVHENEILGPLMLDKLYKSGFAHFPIVNSRKEVIGVLHTEALNSLSIKETDRAKKYLDPKVYYARGDYTLEQALAAFARTNCHFLLVIDKESEIVGLLTYQSLIEYLLGNPDATDKFDRDDDRYAVSQREL